MIALTRAVSPRITECELSFIDREPIDFARASAEHSAYEACLRELGCTVEHVDDAPEHPDGVFVEDAAIVLDDFAVITRPGAESRRGETESVARVLGKHRSLRRIEAPGTLDGGDVLAIGDTLFVGRSKRTNDAAIEQLSAWCRVVPIDFHGCLHLKSAVTYVGDHTLLANRDWVDTAQFGDLEVVEVEEPHAANALRIGSVVVLPSTNVRTAVRLRSHGFHVRPIDVRELAKAEAGVTCCSLIV
jgi:dimethylargininase